MARCVVYCRADETRHVPGDLLLSSHFPNVPLWKGLALEGLANRDSLPYAAKYGMGTVGDLASVFRGTLRWVLVSQLIQVSRVLASARIV
jgi:alpha-aminoadipic semialdehyde synthase